MANLYSVTKHLNKKKRVHIIQVPNEINQYQ